MFLLHHRFTFELLDALGQSNRILRVYPHRRLCDGVSCRVYADGHPLYFDDDHLSVAGADYIAPLFEPVFAGAPALTPANN